jgi:hypothetical protein
MVMRMRKRTRRRGKGATRILMDGQKRQHRHDLNYVGGGDVASMLVFDEPRMATAAAAGWVMCWMI